MFVKLYKIGEVHFRLFYSNSFHVKAKNERFTAAGSHCTKISSRHLAHYSISRVHVLGHKYILGPTRTHRTMRSAQNISMPKNINCSNIVVK